MSWEISRSHRRRRRHSRFVLTRHCQAPQGVKTCWRPSSPHKPGSGGVSSSNRSSRIVQARRSREQPNWYGNFRRLGARRRRASFSACCCGLLSGFIYLFIYLFSSRARSSDSSFVVIFEGSVRIVHHRGRFSRSQRKCSRAIKKGTRPLRIVSGRGSKY